MPPVDSPWRVPFDGSVDLGAFGCEPPQRLEKKDAKARLEEHVDAIREAQYRLYAEDRQSLLLVFQAMDAAGKDGTIRRLLSGVNPAGCHVASFKRPSSEELDHDFLWRHVRQLPRRGIIGVHNRSWYEEVLVVRVNPGILQAQRLDAYPTIWDDRLRSIRELEAHLHRNGTRVVKFFLNVSYDEQARRLRARIDEPDKRWKFEEGDLSVRQQWDDYQRAYQATLAATSRPEAPWYAIPADHKWTMRVTVADVVRRTLEDMDPQVPEPQDIDWEDARRRLR